MTPFALYRTARTRAVVHHCGERFAVVRMRIPDPIAKAGFAEWGNQTALLHEGHPVGGMQDIQGNACNAAMIWKRMLEDSYPESCAQSRAALLDNLDLVKL